MRNRKVRFNRNMAQICEEINYRNVEKILRRNFLLEIATKTF